MKGLVFTEFMSLVEARFGLETLDHIITAAELPNDGAYTSVGTYDHMELIRMVVHLSNRTDIPADTLVQVFGEHLCGQFVRKFPDFFSAHTTTFDFLDTVDEYIHVEVKKLYPDATLPAFTTVRPTPTSMEMTYRSVRCLSALAEGLLNGAISHFGEDITLAKNVINPDGSEVVFTLEKVAA